MPPRKNPLIWNPAPKKSTTKAQANTAKAAGAAAQARTAPKPTPQKAADTRYVVKRGDNLSKIAAKHDTTVAKVLKLNPNLKKNPDLVWRGTKVKLK